MTFTPDLIARVRHGLDRAGYCFLTSDEIRRLLATLPEGHRARHRALQEFARICGAEVEVTANFKSARFVPAPSTSRHAPVAGEELHDAVPA